MAAHIDMGIDDRVVPYLGAFIDDGKGHDGHIFTDSRIGRDTGQGADDAFHLLAGTEQFQQLRKSFTGIFHPDDRPVLQLPFPVRQDHGTGTAFPAHLHIGLYGKGNLRRSRFRQAVDTGNLQVRPVFERSVKQCCQFLQCFFHIPILQNKRTIRPGPSA